MMMNDFCNLNRVLKVVLKVVLLVFVIHGLWSCQFPSFFSSIVDVSSSPNDRREYRYIELPNQLKVLLVSDQEAPQAAASLDVHVGSRNDPPSRQGLAHFLEHMLFLGTNKYPNADEYQQFISQHGGSHNAYTSKEHTNYFFSIETDYFDAALDRFADFFVSPLFQEAYVEREINAVESEYRSQIDNPYRQIQEATQQLISPKNPLSQFSVGNVQTLSSDTLRDELVAFFNANYSASRMSLTVIGNYSLDELEQMVDQRFSGIVNNGSVMQPINMPLFNNHAIDKPHSKIAFPTLLAVKTDKPLRRLLLTFPLPDVKKYFRSKPTVYISDVIGYEGERSVLSVLKQRGLAEALSAGVEPGYTYTGGSALQVAVNLTEKGFNHIDEIVEAVYVVIGKLLEEQQMFPVRAEQRFQELSQLANIAFRFYEYPAPVNTAVSASSGLHFYPPGSVISGAYDYSVYDADAIIKFGELLRPDNMLLTIASNTLPVSLKSLGKTQWYSVPFSIRAVSTEWKDRWIAARAGTSKLFGNSITLPSKNPFIPTNFSIVSTPLESDQANIPKALVDKEGLQVWWKTDETFSVPKADVQLAFFTRHANDSLKNQALAGLFAKVINEQLSEFVYPAYQAGSWLSFFPHVRGFSLKLGGYNDGLHRLLEKALQAMNKINVNEQRFNDLRVEQIRQFSSALQATPSRRLGTYLGTQLIDFNSDYHERITMLEQLTLADLNAFAHSIWDDAYTLALLHGNIDEVAAEKILGLIEEKGYCTCSREEADQISVVQLEKGVAHSAVQLPHNDKAVLWYFQAANDNLQAVAAVALTADITQPLFYHSLRTEQQLGYIVGVGQYNLHRLPGLKFSVQSPDTSEVNIIRSIETFLQDFITTPASAKVFNSHKSALMSRLSKQDNHLHERTNRFWSSITLGELGFNRLDQLREAVNQLSYDEWLVFMRNHLGDGRRSLLVTTAQDRESQNSEARNKEGQNKESELKKTLSPLNNTKPWSGTDALLRMVYSGG